MAQFQLAAAADIPANSMRAFEVGGRRVLVVNVDGTFYALDDLCPHLAIPLSRGELKEGCVVCPGHGSMFDVKTGTAIRWVGLPITWLTRLVKGRATNAQVYPIRVENDHLLVEL
jgi:3-phenylpropionate/trans-cinnamate dioxygenase ferredoxin component